MAASTGVMMRRLACPASDDSPPVSPAGRSRPSSPAGAPPARLGFEAWGLILILVLIIVLGGFGVVRVGVMVLRIGARGLGGARAFLEIAAVLVALAVVVAFEHARLGQRGRARLGR